MIEIMVLLSIIVTTIYLAVTVAAFGSKPKHSGRMEYYAPVQRKKESV